MREKVSKLFEPLQDRERPKPPVPPRASANDNDADQGNPLNTRQGDEEVTIEMTNTKKLSAVGPTSGSGAVRTVDQTGQFADRETGKAVEVPNNSKCNHRLPFGGS